jgi:hypothetical protein
MNTHGRAPAISGGGAAVVRAANEDVRLQKRATSNGKKKREALQIDPTPRRRLLLVLIADRSRK